MSTETEPRSRRSPDPVDFDVEREVDLGRYGSAIAARWWLVLAGLVVGAAIGYLLSLGGSQVYQARALVYLGQPFSPTGSAPVQSLATNPSTVRSIVTSESVIRHAAATAGMHPADLRGKISTQAISGSTGLAVAGRASTNPLVSIIVKGRQPVKVARATNALSQAVVSDVSPYVDQKIASIRAQLGTLNASLATLDRRLAIINSSISSARGLSSLDQLVLISQAANVDTTRGQLVQQQSQLQQQLSLAENVERAKVVARGAPVKVTARSRRNSVVVAALIGAILGVLAALLWEPVANRFAR
jgi:hypothetical protein